MSTRLVDAEALRTGLDELDGTPGWLPLLPLRLAPEVAAARAELDGGALGRVTDVAITSYHGLPALDGWQDDEARPATPFESAVWALDLAERLAGAEVERTRWPRPPDSAHSVVEHRLGADVLATVWHLPCSLGPGPAFSAILVAERGQLLLRQPFAPGGLAIWLAETRELTVPELAKPNPAGTAVSTPGGWELHTLRARLTELADEPTLGADERARAIRIVRHLDRDM